jgi:hypothetical protein
VAGTPAAAVAAAPGALQRHINGGKAGGGIVKTGAIW